MKITHFLAGGSAFFLGEMAEHFLPGGMAMAFIVAGLVGVAVPKLVEMVKQKV